MTVRHIVAVGGSDAGISAALRARELDPTTDVTVVVADAYPNFSICGIPYYVSGEVTHWTNLAHRTAADLAATGMRVVTDTRAAGINVEEHTLDVLDSTGAPQQLSYDALIVGTGAISARPPFRGLSGPDALGPADGVHLLHSMGDTFAVMDSLQQRNPATAVIVGAGYIGLEMAEALTSRGIHVTQIEALPEVLPTVDPELGALVHAELERHGVEVLTNTAVTAITRAASGMLFLRLHDGDRLRWYRVVYWLVYRLGLTVWRRPSPPADLVALVEGSLALPAGRALDLGCGTGTDTIYLATHGWEVTGVDMVPKALAIARRDAAAAGVAPRLVQGDVTRLHDLGLRDGYTLVLDFGCFHTLPQDRRAAYVAGVSEAAAPGATLLLYGFRRAPKAAPMHAGVTKDEVQQRFSGVGWELISAEQTSAETIRREARRAADRFELWRYQLRRRSV